MDQKEHKTDIPHLLVREIQAPLVSALIQGFAKDIGEDNAVAIAQEVIRKDAVVSGKALAEKYAGNSLEVLLQAVEDVWAKDGTLEIQHVRLTEESLQFDVTSCAYAEMYERLGIKELGCLLSCSRDFTFMEGFNPEFELTRTQTIMEGADYCDFRYNKK